MFGPRFIVACIFMVVCAHHFGSSFWPQSDAEVMCDGIACLLFSLSSVK